MKANILEREFNDTSCILLLFSFILHSARPPIQSIRRHQFNFIPFQAIHAIEIAYSALVLPACRQRSLETTLEELALFLLVQSAFELTPNYTNEYTIFTHIAVKKLIKFEGTNIEIKWANKWTTANRFINLHFIILYGFLVCRRTYVEGTKICFQSDKTLTLHELVVNADCYFLCWLINDHDNYLLKQ